MRDFHLRFCIKAMAKLFGKRRDVWFDTNDSVSTFDLLEDEESDIPDEPGAYILGTADGTMIVYPWGTSPIYYIGKASNIRNRLSTHKKSTSRAKNDHQENPWWPRDQYGAAFGAHCVWYLADDKNPQNLEATLIESFYWTYGAIPVANHKWPNYLEPEQEG